MRNTPVLRNKAIFNGEFEAGDHLEVDLALPVMAQVNFDPDAYGPIYFLQEQGLWIVDANEFLAGKRVWISVVVPSE